MIIGLKGGRPLAAHGGGDRGHPDDAPRAAPSSQLVAPSNRAAAGEPDAPPPQGVTQLYGRRRGHRLSRTQQHLIDTLYPRLAIPIGEPAPEDLRRLFPKPVAAIRLEIGFGGGEHLIEQARAHPDLGFMGVEPFENGMAKALSAIAETGLVNVRLFQGDARHVLVWLPTASLDRVFLLYPDPWPKRRQLKRRLVSEETLAMLARVLRPAGELRFASDSAGYVEWTRDLAARHPDFRITRDDSVAWPGWQSTRYEAKALAAGRAPHYLTIERI